MTEKLEKPSNFKYSSYFQITYTSLCLLNFIPIFKTFKSKNSNLNLFINTGFVNSFISCKDSKVNYKDSIYLVFTKNFSYKRIINVKNRLITILEFFELHDLIIDSFEDTLNYIFVLRITDEKILNYYNLLINNNIEEIPKRVELTELDFFFNNFKHLFHYNECRESYAVKKFYEIKKDDLEIVNLNCNDLLHRK